MKAINENLIKMAEILKALGHPSRIKILRLLNTKKGSKISVTQIHENLGLTQSETSRHLIILKTMSVLLCEKTGGNSFYSINDKNEFVSSIVESLNKNF
jgi:DNA-binding transcriptional ArsR family regulator